MTLRGPAHPDEFRVQVGRFRQRWYVDPLPEDDIAGATTDKWPSVTTVGNAWPKFLQNWAARMAAEFAADNLATLEPLDRQARIDLISKAPDRHRDKAASRGSSIHDLLEQLAGGQEPMIELTPDAEPYLPAMRALLADCQPEYVLSEVVAISRELGVGGTLDAVWRIPQLGDGLWLVDFKTRAEHRVYPENAVQLGFYGSADYVIVERDGQAARAVLPELEGALVITITPDGYRLHPVDLEPARAGAGVLREFWEVQRCDFVGQPLHIPRRAEPGEAPDSRTGTGEDPFSGLVTVADGAPPQRGDSGSAAAGGNTVDEQGEGTPPDGGSHRHLAAVPDPASPERIQWLRDRMVAISDAGFLERLADLWPEGIPTLRDEGHAHTDAEVDLIAGSCALVEMENELPFSPMDPAAEPGKPLPADDPIILGLIDRVRALPDDLGETVAASLDGRKIPGLRSGLVTAEHALLVTGALDAVGPELEERGQRVDMLLDAVERTHGPQWARAALRLVSLTAERLDTPALTAGQVDTLDEVCDAVLDGYLELGGGGSLDNQLVPTEKAAGLVVRHGGKRDLLKAARFEASQRGLASPRSTDDALSSPLIVAALAAAPQDAPAQTGT